MYENYVPPESGSTQNLSGTEGASVTGRRTAKKSSSKQQADAEVFSALDTAHEGGAEPTFEKVSSAEADTVDPYQRQPVTARDRLRFVVRRRCVPCNKDKAVGMDKCDKCKHPLITIRIKRWYLGKLVRMLLVVVFVFIAIGLTPWITALLIINEQRSENDKKWPDGPSTCKVFEMAEWSAWTPITDVALAGCDGKDRRKIPSLQRSRSMIVDGENCPPDVDFGGDDRLCKPIDCKKVGKGWLNAYDDDDTDVNSVCYGLANDGAAVVPWPDAASSCASDHPKATPAHFETKQLMGLVIKKLHGGAKKVWIGLNYQLFLDGVWKSGVPLHFLDFDYLPLVQDGDCASFLLDSSTSNAMQKERCTERLPVLCVLESANL